jgi:hypothetical protein
MAIIKNREPIQASKETGRTGAEIFEAYMELMLELAKDSTRRENFLSMDNHQESAKKELKAIGIIITGKIPIYFDKYDTNRPALWLVKGGNACLINEKYLGVKFLVKPQAAEDAFNLKIDLKKGYEYKVDVTAFENIIQETETIPGDLPIEKLTADISKEKFIKNFEHKSLDVEKLFDLKELGLIREAYGLQEEDYMVFAKMPYFEINDDLKIAYQISGYDEIVLTCA